jgi:hypothetical protein
VIARGVEPGALHGKVPDNPARGKAQGRITPTDERVPAARTADGSRSPEVEAIRIPGRSLLQISLPPTGDRSPRRKSIGAEAEARTTRGPGPAEMPRRQADRRELVTCQAAGLIRRECPPGCGIKPAKGRVEPQERRRAANATRREGPASPGQAVLRLERVAERHAEEGAIWRMTRIGRAESQRRRFVVRVARERDDMWSRRRPVCRPAGVASDRLRRSHLHARSKTSVARATGRLPVATPGERAPRMRGNERSRSASDGFGWNAQWPE